MIGRISGTLLTSQPPELLVDVQGVGYELLVSMTTYFQLPALGEMVTLHTHFVVREDAQQLYGFADLTERELFRSLIKISGVGPKLALAILSGMNPAEFAATVQSKSVATLQKLPGVGKRTAERLVVEMQDRLGELVNPVAAVSNSNGAALSVTAVSAPSPLQEAESALVALGYKPQEASKMLAPIESDNKTSQDLIREALKGRVKS